MRKHPTIIMCKRSMSAHMHMHVHTDLIYFPADQVSLRISKFVAENTFLSIAFFIPLSE
jgi:hypothetical protein